MHWTSGICKFSFHSSCCSILSQKFSLLFSFFKKDSDYFFQLIPSATSLLVIRQLIELRFAYSSNSLMLCSSVRDTSASDHGLVIISRVNVFDGVKVDSVNAVCDCVFRWAVAFAQMPFYGDGSHEKRLIFSDAHWTLKMWAICSFAYCENIYYSCNKRRTLILYQWMPCWCVDGVVPSVSKSYVPTHAHTWICKTMSSQMK